jgi:hypothetical protein
MSVRTDRAKEHARVHIGNHPYACERIQGDGRVGWYVIPSYFPISYCEAPEPVLTNARCPLVVLHSCANMIVIDIMPVPIS